MIKIEENPFELMVQHYCLNAVPKIVPNVQAEGIFDQNKNRLLNKKGENSYFNGFIIVYDGEVLLKRSSEMVNRPRQGFRESVPLPTKEAFMAHFKKEGESEDNDFVHFYNSHTGQDIKYKGELRNSYPGIDLEEILAKDLPQNFLSEDGSVPVYDVGTKTGVAPIIPRAYPGVKVVILKNTGTGKVAHFDEHGLVEEFFCPEDMMYGMSFSSKNNLPMKVTGIYRSYRDENGRPNRDREGNLVPYVEKMVDMHLRDVINGEKAGPCRVPVSSAHKIYHPHPIGHQATLNI